MNFAGNSRDATSSGQLPSDCEEFQKAIRNNFEKLLANNPSKNFKMNSEKTFTENPGKNLRRVFEKKFEKVFE